MERSERIFQEWAGFLLVFSENGCMRERLPAIQNGDFQLYLSEKVTGKEERQLMLKADKGKWYWKEQLLSDRSPCYFKVEEELEILLLFSKEVPVLSPCKRIHLGREEVLRVGGAYQNQIFYECFSFILSRELEIYYENEAYVVHSYAMDGVYFNGVFFSGKRNLTEGDEIDVYGLHMVFLQDLLVLCSFCGVCRLAVREDTACLMIQEAELPISLHKSVEIQCPEEENLHAGEIELLSPPPTERKNPTSLLLGLGPGLTMVLPILLMTAVSSFLGQGMGGSFYYLTLVMSVCSSFLALFWGLANHFYTKYQRQEKERNRVAGYREYLERISSLLTSYQEENRAILLRKYPAVPFFIGEKKGLVALWNRHSFQNDALFIRVGIGRLPFQVQLKKKGENTIVTERMWEEAIQTTKQFEVLENAPVGIELKNTNLLGIVGRKKEARKVLLQILFQIAARYTGGEIKVACFYHKGSTAQRQLADCLGKMIHSWSKNGRTRFLAGDEGEISKVLPVLTKALEKGREDLEKGMQTTWYVLVILEEAELVGEPIYQYLTKASEKYPLTGIFLKPHREALALSCNCLLRLEEEEGELIRYKEERTEKKTVRFDVCERKIFLQYMRGLAGCGKAESEEDRQLPEQVSFLELYGCSRVEELNSESRWEIKRAKERLKIPVGLRAGGSQVYLDIHEKFHGPHGLIAGTTGSGKSELLQTFLLSIAVSFSPRDVNFFMIDYKGGGTGNLLRSLPHCVGVISNLSGKQIKRAMSAISSENKRRQKLLSQHHVNHVDSYMELYYQGKLKEPMPHLILVVDEFAELKKEEPEFMQEIISLAQVGRSLGIHLILATQKPAGIVDDKIWSNARFRLCLRVQDGQDSMDMLHTKDAAALTLPGQCYLQIGNHEYYELFQTAYCGSTYEEGVLPKAAAMLVTDTGERVGTGQEKSGEKGKSQLEVVVNYVNQLAKEKHLETARTLWLTELPCVLPLEELTGGRSDGRLILGLCDDPGSQRQYPVFYDPGQQGHMVICGGAATGKTALLQTLLWQLVIKKPQEVQLLIIDINGNGLAGYEKFPHCLGILQKEEEKQVFFYHLKKLIKARREQLKGINYQQSGQGKEEKIPEIFLVVEHYVGLAGILDEEQEEFMLRLLTEGLSLGIYLILTATAIGEIPGRFFEKIKKTIALELSDRFMYGDVLRQYHISVFPEENVKGRGLCKEGEHVLEFQAALIAGETQDNKRMQKIEEQGKRAYAEYRKTMHSPIKRFPKLPEKPDSLMLYDQAGKERGADFLPLGYDTKTGRIQGISPEKTKCFLISGQLKTGRRSLLHHMAEGLLMMGRRVVVLSDEGRASDWKERENLIVLKNWQEELYRLNFVGNKEKLCLLIENMASFLGWLYGTDKSGGGLREEKAESTFKHRKDLQQFLEMEVNGAEHIQFLAGVYQPENDYEIQHTEFFRAFVKGQWGIHLGGNAAEQRVLNFEDLSYSLQNQREKSGIGYFKAGVGAVTRRLKLPVYEGIKQNENEEEEEYV